MCFPGSNPRPLLALSIGPAGEVCPPSPLPGRPPWAPCPQPWGARGGRLALGTLPFLVQAQLPEMGDFEELLVGPMATAYDMQGAQGLPAWSGGAGACFAVHKQ